MSNYNEDKPGFREVRDAYDAMVSARTARRREAMMRVERECAEEDERDRQRLAQLMHRFYSTGTTKTVLRNATRQYGSPKFSELWDAVPFEGERLTPMTGVPAEEKPKGYIRDGNEILFNREAWNWDGIDAHVLTLHYTVGYSESLGKFLLYAVEGEDANAALFNVKNSTELSKLINETEDFSG